MIRLENVVKRFGVKTIIDNLSLTVERGKLFGLLGPNGAGKTTTINMIIGALTPDAGAMSIDGDPDPRQPHIRRMLGVVPQTLAIYENLTAEENLKFFGRLYSMGGQDLKDRMNQVLDIVNLSGRRKERVKKYSGGMKRRLNIAIALLHRPSLLILDEPTVGVDPQSRNAIFESLREVKAAGCTIILTSHYLEEAQKLCDTVGIMDEGRLVAEGSVEKLVADHGGKSVLTVETSNGKTTIETDQPVKEIVRLNAVENIISFQMESPSLEKAFLNITGKHLRD